MRLSQSVLSRLKPTQKPQRKCVAHLWGLLLLLPGQATLRHRRRDSPEHERTCARGYDTDLDGGSLPKTASTGGVPSAPEQAWVIDARCVPNSGQHTSGLARVWNGSHRRTEKGRAISTVAWRDLTGHCADCLRGEQTPASPEPSEPEATRLAVALAQRSRVVTAQDCSCRRDGVTDGASSQQQGVAGVLDLGLPQMGPWRAEAHRRSRSQGPKRPGPGRPKPDDGTVHGHDCSRCARLAPAEEPLVWSPQVRNQVPWKRHLLVVGVVHTQRPRDAVLWSTAGGLEPLRL